MRAFNPGPFTRLATAEDFENLMPNKRFAIFKHSPICGTSAHAFEEVARYSAENEDLPVYIVDVISQRPLSRHIASRLGVTHQSPQLILVDGGRVVWSKSHYAISHKVLSETTV